MNIFFTADTHFDHKNIIKYCNRPFKTIDQMNQTIVDNWNSVVKKDDVVYHLGDFCFGNPEKFKPELNGNIIFIKGSHDGKINAPYMMVISPNNLFDEFGNNKAIVLCHYAMRSWPLSHYASWHLFGHHHGQLEAYGLSFDIGVDTNKFYPYSLLDVENKMKKLKPIVDFRNKSVK